MSSKGYGRQWGRGAHWNPSSCPPDPPGRARTGFARRVCVFHPLRVLSPVLRVRLLRSVIDWGVQDVILVSVLLSFQVGDTTAEFVNLPAERVQLDGNVDAVCYPVQGCGNQTLRPLVAGDETRQAFHKGIIGYRKYPTGKFC